MNDTDINTDNIDLEIRSIIQHLAENYPAHEAVSIAISVMINLVMNIEKEDKAHVLKNMYSLLDAMKYDELDNEIQMH